MCLCVRVSALTIAGSGRGGGNLVFAGVRMLAGAHCVSCAAPRRCRRPWVEPPLARRCRRPWAEPPPARRCHRPWAELTARRPWAERTAPTAPLRD